MAKIVENKEKIFNILKLILRILYYIVVSFICLIVLFLIYYIVSSQIHSDDENYKPKISIYTIVSPSMTPNINVYDVVINVRPDSPKDIQVGDIITYKSTSATSEGMTITHRVIERSQLPDGTYEYMTQGDNNTEPDSVYVTYDNVIGEELITIPYVGRLQFLIANQKGWLFLLLIPICIYLIRQVFKLIDLLGLRRKVNLVVGTMEESIIDKRSKEYQQKMKEKIKEEHSKNEARKAAIIRNPEEEDGFLEKYRETTIKVRQNKYKTTSEESKELEVEETNETPRRPSKVDVKNVKPIKTKETTVSLPKEKPENIEPYEVLDTDDLTSKIKEYNSKIEKLDKMLKSIKDKNPSINYDEEDSIEENFLKEGPIKVIKVENTKNNKRSKIEKVTEELKLEKEVEVVEPEPITDKVELGEPIIVEEKSLEKEEVEFKDIKELRKDVKIKTTTEENTTSKPKANTSNKKNTLKLNPNQVKKINRTTKKNTDNNEKTGKSLNLNPNQVKKINRPNAGQENNQDTKTVSNKSTKKKKAKKSPKDKSPIIVIEKIK